MKELVRLIEEPYLKKEKIPFCVGDTVKVYTRIIEGGKERVQPYEGVVISFRGEGINKSFTIRKISQGVGVEKTFLFHSPMIEKIKLIREGKVRRAKLYYLREKVGKETKIKRK